MTASSHTYGRITLATAAGMLLMLLPTGAVAGPVPTGSPPQAAAAPTVTATGRGADLWFNAADSEGHISDCVRVIRINAQGLPISNVAAGCTGMLDDVYAGIRLGAVGEYGPDAPYGLWNRNGDFLGTLQGSRQACFTTGGDTDWALICTPVSASAAVVSDVSAKGTLTLLSLAKAPRVLARVPAAAGAVVSHDGRTLYTWSSQYLVNWNGTGGKTRSLVSAVNLATGRITTITRAPASQQYHVVCATWGGRLIAIQERRTGQMRVKPLRLVSITAKGRVTDLKVPWGVAKGATGCTADGRSIVYRTNSWGTGTYDRTTRQYHAITDRYTHVDNA